MSHFCLEVSGDYACYTRAESKAERVSYPVMTPSAARAVFEAIFWKPGIRWRITCIEVLKPVRWISVRRNEVGAVASTRNAITAMHEGRGSLGLDIEDERQQRAGLFLRDVAYRVHAEMELLSAEAQSNPGKYKEMFTRRARKGQCVNQPYLGCREFDARFRLVEDLSKEPPADVAMNDDLGVMLYDMNFTQQDNPQPTFFRAQVRQGVIDLRGVEVLG